MRKPAHGGELTGGPGVALKIALLCNEYPPAPHGGIGTFIHTFAHALADRGHAVLVVALADNGAAATRDGDVTLISLRRHQTRGMAWMLDRHRLHTYLSALAASGEIDVLEVPDYEGLLPKPVPGCTNVVRLHLSSTAIAKHDNVRTRFTLRRCEQRTIVNARHWIGVSQYSVSLTEHAFAVRHPHTTVIHYPIAAPEPDAGSLDLPERFVLFAGAVSQRKGALTLARAARFFLPTHPDCHLVFAGPCDTGMADQIGATLGPVLMQRTKFLGRLQREQVYYCMTRAAVFAYPSTLETFGIVVGEAMLAGIPVVVPDIPPFTEFVTAERGILAPPHSTAEFALAVDRLLENTAFARALGERARVYAQCNLSVARAVDQSLAFYSECIDMDKSNRACSAASAAT